MQSPIRLVRDLFAQAIKTAIPAAAGNHEPMIAQSKLADYQCNSAMALQKLFGPQLGVKSPVDMAKLIVNAIPQNNVIQECTVAGPGFINIKLSNDWLTQQMRLILDAPKITYSSPVHKRCAVDFSSPNIAKEMHVGHLRSTIIGESVCRILEFVGHEVHRINHVGDWGTQFGMLIEYMREAYPDFEKNLPDVSDLQEFYKASKARFDEDAEFKKRAQETVVSLQSGDKACLQAWQLICEISRKEFQKVYKRLGINVQERGESTYNPLIASVVEELDNRGLVVESQGAKCIFTSIDQVPLMVVKADGGYGYASTDMAAIFQRLKILRADWLIYITDIGQQSHFYKVFEAAEKAQWHEPPRTRVDHMGLGLVCGADGKKFRTRSGDVVKLVDLLDAARDSAYEELRNRAIAQATNEDGVVDPNVQIDEELLMAKAEKVGISSIKYFDMKRDISSNYQFSYESMLDPRGNSAVFLIYAYARICQLLEKCVAGSEGTPGIDLNTLTSEELLLAENAEQALALHLARFPEVLESILADLGIHKLSEYLYELSDKLSSFYTQCRVFGSEQQKSRMQLVRATRKVFDSAFFLLGIEPLEKL